MVQDREGRTAGRRESQRMGRDTRGPHACELYLGSVGIRTDYQIPQISALGHALICGLVIRYLTMQIEMATSAQSAILALGRFAPGKISRPGMRILDVPSVSVPARMTFDI